MSATLRVSIHLLDGTFHGRADDDEPEWPPSPLRLFQALVAASFARTGGAPVALEVSEALRWVERATPEIVAPPVARGTGFRLSVPNNAMDIPARVWARRSESTTGDANPATHRTMKNVRPLWLRGGETLHYLYGISDLAPSHVDALLACLRTVARSVVAFGWGLDLAIGDATVEDIGGYDAESVERWTPVEAGGECELRTPTEGTLEGLVERHREFVDRMSPEGIMPPRPFTAFRRVGYRRASMPEPRAFAAFAILRLDAEGFRAFDPVRHGLRVAGMLRHAASTAAFAAGWDAERVAREVLGHAEARGQRPAPYPGPRMAFIPVPSLEAVGPGRQRVGAIRRVIVSSSADGAATIAWSRRALSGVTLRDEMTGADKGVLSHLPDPDPMIERFVRSASAWSTVTPMVLPGLEDPGGYRARIQAATPEIEAARSQRRQRRGESAAEERQRLEARIADRVEALIRKAIVQAGLPETWARWSDVEWSDTGFRAGVSRADAYGVPNHLRRYPRLHVRIVWRDGSGTPIEVRGPLCLGGGRYFGIGLFAGED